MKPFLVENDVIDFLVRNVTLGSEFEAVFSFFYIELSLKFSSLIEKIS